MLELPPEKAPEVKKIKTKLNKKEKAVEFVMEGSRLSFSLTGESLEEGSSAFLVSPCNENGENTRIPLMLYGAQKNGKKITFEADSDMLQGGTYALVLETPSGTQITYVELASGSFSSKMIALSETQAEEQFLRSETLDLPEVVDVPKKDVAATVTNTNEEDVVLTKEACDAAFMDSKNWKIWGHAFCYDKTVEDEKRLTMRFFSKDNYWWTGSVAIYSDSALRLLRKGTAIKITIANDSNRAENVELKLFITEKRKMLNGEHALLKEIQLEPQSKKTFVLPYRDFKNTEGFSAGHIVKRDQELSPDLEACSSDFDSNRIKNLELRLPLQNNRLEITELSVIDDSLPLDAHPFYNDHWIGIKENKNISLIENNGKTALRLTSVGGMCPESATASLSLFANYSNITAKELCNAEGIKFSAKADRKGKWSVIIVQGATGWWWDVSTKWFTLEKDKIQEITVSFKDFGDKFDSSHILGIQFRHSYMPMDENGGGNAGGQDFTQTLIVSDLHAYGKGKNLQANTYTEPLLEEETTETISDEKIEEPLEKTKLVYPKLFTALGFNACTEIPLIEAPKFVYGAELRIFDLRWFSIDSGSAYDVAKNRFLVNAQPRFALPIKGFKPYVGAGIGMFWGDHSPLNMYCPIFAGLTLFGFLDLRYNCNLYRYDLGSNSPLWMFEDSVTLGIVIRLRKPKSVALPSPNKAKENSSVTGAVL